MSLRTKSNGIGNRVEDSQVMHKNILLSGANLRIETRSLRCINVYLAKDSEVIDRVVDVIATPVKRD